MALYKAVTIWRESSNLSLNSRLVRVLVRDQAIYLLACVCVAHTTSLQTNTFIFRLVFVSILSIIPNFVQESLLVSGILGFAGSPAILSFLGARLLFNIKEAGEKGLDQGTSCGSGSTVSDIDFAEPPPGAASESQSELTELEVIELDDVC